MPARSSNTWLDSKALNAQPRSDVAYLPAQLSQLIDSHLVSISGGLKELDVSDATCSL